MKRWNPVILLSLLALCVASNVLAEITVRLEFPLETVSFETVDGYDVVSVEGCELFGEAGEPLLPTRAVYVSLPPGFEMTGVRISENEQIQLPGTFDIAPAQPVRPISQPDLYDFVPPEPSAYSLSAAQPAKQLVSTGEGSLRGFRVLGLIVYPVQYVAGEKKLLLSTELTIEVTGEGLPLPLDTRPESTLAGDVAARSLVGSLVENPDGVMQEPSATPLYWRNKCDVLIITQVYFVSSFDDLRDWYYRKGYRTEIITIDTIESEYHGRDLPVKIRNCIRDYYINQGLGWVILGGDAREVPTRRGARSQRAGAMRLWSGMNMTLRTISNAISITPIWMAAGTRIAMNTGENTSRTTSICIPTSSLVACLPRRLTMPACWWRKS